MSDPLRRYGASRTIDGLTLLKNGKELPYSSEVEEVTKGEWNSQLAAFAQFFGSKPIVALRFLIWKELEFCETTSRTVLVEL